MNDKRNWKIYFSWIDGKDYRVLAKEFHLSEETIKHICMEKVPGEAGNDTKPIPTV
jgi:Mor family transcriptional regulator